VSALGTIVLYSGILALLVTAVTQLAHAARQRRRQFLAVYPAPDAIVPPIGAAYERTMGFIGTAEGGIDQDGSYIEVLVTDHGFVIRLPREPQVRLYFPWHMISDVVQETRYGSPFTRIALSPFGVVQLYGDAGFAIHGGWRTWERQQPGPAA
jgi:hypothetical protein